MVHINQSTLYKFKQFISFSRRIRMRRKTSAEIKLFESNKKMSLASFSSIIDLNGFIGNEHTFHVTHCALTAFTRHGVFHNTTDNELI